MGFASTGYRVFPQAHMFEHLAPSWQDYFERLWNCGGRRHVWWRWTPEGKPLRIITAWPHFGPEHL